MSIKVRELVAVLRSASPPRDFDRAAHTVHALQRALRQEGSPAGVPALKLLLPDRPGFRHSQLYRMVNYLKWAPEVRAAWLEASRAPRVANDIDGARNHGVPPSRVVDALWEGHDLGLLATQVAANIRDLWRLVE